MNVQLQDFQVHQFEEDLINWFQMNKRDLPWRKTNDPYKIWVSEIMLQQTKVDTVIPYYEAFMRKFPTIETLAYAEEDEVLKAWEGLGYYSRARNLQTAVREVAEQYDGVVPDTREEISKLKGVGPYTAGAVLSIAYKKSEPAVDGNVMRVLSRVLLIEDDIMKASTRKKFETILYTLISNKDPSSFNQGLMELGALVCTPTSPGCLLCPVREHCRAYERGVQMTLPVKTKKKKPKRQQLITVIIRNELGELLIEKRANKGLLASLWQFPTVEADGKDVTKFVENTIKEYSQGGADFSGPVQTVEHIFSHLIWTMNVYETVIKKSAIVETDERIFVTMEQLEQYTFPVPYQKMIQRLRMEE